jgi:hypothetical protein
MLHLGRGEEARLPILFTLSTSGKRVEARLLDEQKLRMMNFRKSIVCL